MISEQEIERVAARLAEASHAERVIVFGSHARGAARESSDVDLLIIAESDLPRFKRSVPLYKALRPYPFAMDLLVYTPEEVEQGKRSDVSFLSTILREGKTVYVRKPSGRSAVACQSDE